MASSERKMEDALTCAICTEVFREPVTLPCQHSYCRECLQQFSVTPDIKPVDVSLKTPTQTLGLLTQTDEKLTQTDRMLTHTEATPTQTEATPTQTEATPTQTEATPTQTEAAPTQTEATPKQTEATPTQTEAAPTQTEATPTQTEATPTQTEAPPTQTEARPTKADVLINCPICRKPANLGPRGVANLPTNFTLSEIVENFQAGRCTKAAGPVCGICEDDKAVKACSTCDVLYCTECFTSLHPERGALRQHVVISVEEYMAQQKTPDLGSAEELKTEDINPQAHQTSKCDKHTEQMLIYCVTCDEVMGAECLLQHDKHSVRDISLVCQEKKVPFLEKVKGLEKLKDELVDCQQKIQNLIDEIKTQERSHMAEIQRAYEIALKSLQTWKTGAEKTVREKYKKCQDQFDVLLKDLQIKLEEIESLEMTTTALTSGEDIGFLQEAKMLSKRLDDQLQTTEDAVKKDLLLMKNCNEFLEDDVAPLRHLSLSERIVKSPNLKFVSTGVKIKEGGLVLESEFSSSENVHIPTNTSFQSLTGIYYWEFEVTVNLGDDACAQCKCDIGVRHTDITEAYTVGKAWWGMTLSYNNNQFQPSLYNNLKQSGSVSVGYKGWKPYPGRHNLGVCLDCENRVLILIDCSQKQAIVSLRLFNLSKPFTPTISFYCEDGPKPAVCASTRLITRDTETLRQMLSEVNI